MTNHNFVDEDFEEWGPGAGLTPDGATKYFDTNFPATSLRDDPHLCYIEQSETGFGAGSGMTALGVTNGSLEWSIGEAATFSTNRSVILGDPAVLADTASPYTNFTSVYVGNRESPTSLTLFKRTHLKSTNTTLSAISPKPALNLFLAARNNAGVPDQFFAARLRYASIGQAMSSDEIPTYYQLVQSLQDALGRAI